MKKIEQSQFDAYFEELSNMTSYVIDKNSFFVKSLYGGNKKMLYIDEHDLYSHKTLYFKLFDDKEFINPLDGYYYIDSVSILTNKIQVKMVYSPHGNSFMILLESLSKIKNENELSISKAADYSDLNIPISELTILDFIAISLKKPISNNNSINNLIKNVK